MLLVESIPSKVSDIMYFKELDVATLGVGTVIIDCFSYNSNTVEPIGVQGLIKPFRGNLAFLNLRAVNDYKMLAKASLTCGKEVTVLLDKEDINFIKSLDYEDNRSYDDCFCKVEIDCKVYDNSSLSIAGARLVDNVYQNSII